MTWIDLLIGSSLGQRLVIVGTVVVYGWLALRRPTIARDSVTAGIQQFARLFTLILAALFLAQAIGVLLPREAIAAAIGTTAGTRGIIFAGILGGFIPGGPYAVYPIVRSLSSQGAPLAALITMLVGYGAIGLSRIPYGLVFFDERTVGLRLLIGVGGTVLTALVAVVVF
ncbi:MAG: hypothetical protein ABEJ84_00425 [Halodesulfurarchaeum sp.]